MNEKQSEAIQRLDPETIERYFSSPATVVHLLCKNPRCELRIDPLSSSLELRTSNDGSCPDLGNFKNIELLRDIEDDSYCLKLSTQGLHYAAYSFVAHIVDEIRLGSNLSQALSRSIREYENLLQNRNLLSSEQQTGLIGELLLFNYLCKTSPEMAIASWLGPESEQHDFSFGSFDLEVKTTKSEERIHRIGSITQLEPSSNRDLWFLSIQITAAGSAENSFSLVSLIDSARQLLGVSTLKFNEYIEKLGWNEADRRSYRGDYILRANPAFYRVNDQFPALRTSILSAGVPHFEYIADISYRTNISHLPQDDGPPFISSFKKFINSQF